VVVGGIKLTVINIARGYDLGDTDAHITTNISPAVDSAADDFYFTNKVEASLSLFILISVSADHAS
jgi:hypothetical protein